MNGIVQQVLFSRWLLTCSLMFLRFIHGAALANILFLFTAESCSIISVDHILFVRLSLMDIWVFPIFFAFAIMNNIATNIGMQAIFLSKKMSLLKRQSVNKMCKRKVIMCELSVLGRKIRTTGDAQGEGIWFLGSIFMLRK